MKGEKINYCNDTIAENIRAAEIQPKIVVNNGITNFKLSNAEIEQFISNHRRK